MDERLERFGKGNIFEHLIKHAEPLEEMNERQLRDEVKDWRAVMARIPIDVQEAILMFDEIMTVQQHNFKSIVGTLVGIKCQVTHFTLASMEERLDSTMGKYVLDDGLVQIPTNAVKRWTLVEKMYDKPT